MKNLLVFRYLDWPRFLCVFFFLDLSTLVIPAWALALRTTGVLQDSLGLENLRQLSADAHQEFTDLLDEAAERADRDAPGAGRP